MLAEVMLIETEPSGETYSVAFALQGEPVAIAKEIASHSGDLHALCLEGKLLNYSILTTFITKNGTVVVR